MGRKWPIMLAGLLLGDASMQNIGFDYDNQRVFQEDGQIFLLTQADRDATYWVSDDPNDPFYRPGYYDEVSLGTGVWAERYLMAQEVSFVDLPGWPNYAFCCTANDGCLHGYA